MDAPRCFISYSWDSEKHREWVRKLATRLDIRVIRGGGWYGGPQRCGSAIRGRFPPGNSDIDLGFRLAGSITSGP